MDGRAPSVGAGFGRRGRRQPASRGSRTSFGCAGWSRRLRKRHRPRW